MKTTAIVSEKGQVTIPKSLRVRLGIKNGTILNFENAEGKIIISKKATGDVIDKWRGKGKLPFGNNTDEYLEVVRYGHRR
ncbi:MAG: AbrB/MazE/SpoVT family DNA-binding domain-containing protein [Verrucomicrobiota bacterium]|nr:AbrB/MazE/SpoVT family DNA-binding domain-containing protein [Verrucomicrobiota bacterium]